MKKDNLKNFKVCLVISNYYPKISDDLFKNAKLFLIKNGIKNKNIKSFKVEGSFEIPLVISKNIKKFDFFVALGCIIKGETPHFDLISSTIIEALMNLSLKHNKPIGNGIITSLNIRQALVRSSHLNKNKGKEAAKAALSLFKILKQ
jgi:6,7-dimethyl-8-ribityllumazine synthase